MGISDYKFHRETKGVNWTEDELARNYQHDIKSKCYLVIQNIYTS